MPKTASLPLVSEDDTDALGVYREEIGRRVSSAMERKALEGSATGRVPLGYFADADEHGNSRVIADPERAPLVAAAFRLAAGRGMSVRLVLEDVTGRGLRNHRGMPLSLSTMHLVLTNPFYAGLVRYKGRLFPGRHEALVSRTLFDAVQRGFRKRRC